MGDRAGRDLSIWGFAFGYFACYAPYTALTKAVTDGRLAALDGVKVPGTEILPVSGLASLVGMLAFISAMRWWGYAGRRRILGRELPWPSRWTFLSGLCTAAIIATTTLAYTISGASIVFMMLLMRGGVLVIAPIIDLLSRRHVRWFSLAALVLSLAALLLAVVEGNGMALPLLAAIDVTIYVGAYFVRLQFMSRQAKSDDTRQRTRYFVEEQMVATPMLMLFYGVLALIDHGQFMHELRLGFTSFFDRPVVLEGVLIGLFSQGTGVFGGLILLDKSENTYSVPVNRCSSVLAGLVASYALWALFGLRAPGTTELVGAGLILGAILFLTVPLLTQRRPG